MASVISTINLCSVDFMPNNQMYFKTRELQKNYFTGKVVRTIPNCRYTARTSNMRVTGFVDNIRDCNYGYYDNEYQGLVKRFYFWIVKKEYIAKDLTELTIQIDVFQTWLFDMRLNDCYIERGHVDDDTIGANTIPEDFELGDYVNVSRETIEEMQGEVCYLIGITDSDSDLIGTKYGKIYSGFKLRFYREDSTNELSTYIQDLAKSGKADAIAFIFIYPYEFFRQTIAPLTSGAFIGNIEKILSLNHKAGKMKEYFKFGSDEYLPRNNKLLTYPYNMMVIQNASGSNVVLKYELFENSQFGCYFNVESILTQNAKFTLTPLNYNGVQSSYENGIESAGFGLCSWNNDNYSNWFAMNQNTINSQSANAGASYKATSTVQGNNYDTGMKNNAIGYMMNGINAATQLGIGIGTFNGYAVSNGINSGLSAMAGAVQNKNTLNNDLANGNLMNTTNYQNTIRSLNASIQDAKIQPNSCKGDTSSGGLDVSRETNTFFISQMAIKPEYARIIDDYYQKYGYPIRRFDNPRKFMVTRERWNYIKTLDCIVTGNIPKEDRDAIAGMFDNGFTVWHGENYLYNYNIDNAIN